MKKLIGVFILLFILLPSNVSAGNATISLRSNKATYIVGNTVSITATVSADTNIGGWEFALKYDTSKLRFVSSTTIGGTSVVDFFSQSGQKSKTYTFTFRAISSGSANLWISGAEVYDVNDVKHNTKITSLSLKIMTQAELESTFSKNNYLKTLEVVGYDITPKFSKDILNYSATLKPETKTATIKATVEDSKASLRLPEITELKDGNNEFKIVVEAQNGVERIYNLNLIVEELDPIIVKVGQEEFSMIRKKEQLDCPDLFSDKELKYNNEAIPGCYSEITKTTLMALKDAKGNVSLFINENDVFKPYKELIINRLILYPSELKNSVKIPVNTLKKTIEISDQQVVAYQFNDNKDFFLVYGKNMETNEEKLYIYDSKEMTMQRYIEKKENNENKYFIIIIALAILSSILLVSTSLLLYKNKKRKQKLNKVIEQKITQVKKS